MRRVTLWITLLLLGGGLVSLAEADSGILEALSLTAARTGGLNVDFTVEQTTLTSTTSNFVTTAFSGTLDFGDGDSTSGFTMDVDEVNRPRKAIRNKLTGVVSHTYPAPGTYTATVTNCCLFEYFYDGYPYTSNSIELNDSVTVTVPPEDDNGSGCTEPTLFAQIACLLGNLGADTGDAGFDDPLTADLLGKVTDAQALRGESETACQEGDAPRAQSKMNSAVSKLNTLIGTLTQKRNKGEIDAAVADDLIAQTQAVVDLMEGLVQAGVCSGAACLATPALGAINCELQQLINDVTAAALDAKLATKLLKQLDKAKASKEEAETLCAEDNETKATKKLKATDKKVKAFARLVGKEGNNGNIAPELVTDWSNRAENIRGIAGGLLTAGACSG